MTEILIRERNQLTVPVDIAREAGIGPGTVCHMEIKNGIISITPAHAAQPRRWESFRGIASGVWGKTPAEVDREITRTRETWQR